MTGGEVGVIACVCTYLLPFGSCLGFNIIIREPRIGSLIQYGWNERPPFRQAGAHLKVESPGLKLPHSLFRSI